MKRRYKCSLQERRKHTALTSGLTAARHSRHSRLWSTTSAPAVPANMRVRQQAQALVTAFLKDRDCTASANALPRQTKYQGLKLLGIQFQLATLSNAWPLKLALIQPACRQPHADPIMHQHFHPVGPSIGKQISAVRLRRTEYRNDSGQRVLGTSTHIHGLGGEPDGVDADHRNRSRRKVAQTAALSVGQFTLTVPRGCWISTQIFDDVASELAPASCMGNGINAGCSAVF